MIATGCYVDLNTLVESSITGSPRQGRSENEADNYITDFQNFLTAQP